MPPQILLPLGIGLAFLATVAAVTWMLRRAVIAAQLEAADTPLPPDWMPSLARLVPASQGLSDADRLRLLRLSRDLIGRLHWEGCRGVLVDEMMRLAIAAQACLITLGIPGEHYETIREVLIYPSTFVPRPSCNTSALAAVDDGPPVPELGECWLDGTIVLSWEAAQEGAGDPHDGRNTVYHEFAHALANEHDLIPLPIGLAVLEQGDLPGEVPRRRPDLPNPDEWTRVLRESFDRLTDRLAAGKPSVLGPYAATKYDEFFAVATEAFFEKARDLRDEEPAFYEQLCAFYRRNPAEHPSLTKPPAVRTQPTPDTRG